jgi:hypothetical protein
MLQINPFLDCTVYSGIIVHIGRNSHFKQYSLIIGLGFICVSGFIGIIYKKLKT